TIARGSSPSVRAIGDVGASGSRSTLPETTILASPRSVSPQDDRHSAGETTILLPRRSVSQQAIGESAGERSASPERRLKQAWCQGQRTVWPSITPSASGPP